ncbi:MAG: nucleotide exchange factor GrpE [Chromatiales bacterium]|jgi:molecular chaperone GrpE
MEQDKVYPDGADEASAENPTEQATASPEQEAQANTEAAPGNEDSPENLHLMLEDARAKADEHWEMVIRARAEAENLKKRHQRELENAHKYAIDKFANELLPVRDSLELGLNAGKDEGAELAKLIEGTELTLKLLTDVMGKFGIEEIDPQGQPFNPELHQAMAMQPSAEVEPNTVVAVVQKGYTLNGRLVRPAMVMVSQAAG